MIEVILKEPVDNLGNRGDVVKVAPGYARNYLLPRKLALAVTEGNKRQIEAERKRAAATEAEREGGAGMEAEGGTGAEALSARVKQVEVVVARRVGEKDTLYGSVTSADITEALARQGFEIDRRKVQLPEPLKHLGEFSV